MIQQNHPIPTAVFSSRPLALRLSKNTPLARRTWETTASESYSGKSKAGKDVNMMMRL